MKALFAAAGREPVSAFVSDTHLFHSLNGALDTQGHIIDQLNPDRLYLLGDIIDYEYLQDLLLEMIESEGFDINDTPERFEDFIDLIPESGAERYLRFLDIIMTHKARGMKVFMTPGNHDNNLDMLNGQTVHGIEFDEYFLHSFGGVMTHLEHGDDNDPAALKNYSGLYARCSGILNFGLKIDTALSRGFNMLSGGKRRAFPITNALKAIGKSFITTFRETAIKRAMERGARATVLGHIHKADISNIQLTDHHPEADIYVKKNGFVYRNTGDGLTHGTAIVYDGQRTGESPDGWRIVTRRDIQPDNSFDPAAPNPFAAYRHETLAFLQTCWETFLVTCDIRQKWEHNSARKMAAIRQNPFDTPNTPPFIEPALPAFRAAEIA
ncbi:MAG: hypothetical protein GC137_02895 [Alphaproteobacteria bacterium]|nr:hypothetical protein [Alphaproteobacteria bacterium]